MILAILFSWFSVALPAYVVRFSIGPLPTTLLEVLFGVLMVWLVLQEGMQVFRDGWNALRAVRVAATAWVLAGLVAVVMSPVPLQGLGLWRAYFFEPMVFLVALSGLALRYPQQLSRERVERGLWWLAMWVSAYGLWQYLTGHMIPAPWNVALDAGRRAVGPFPYPNALALLVAPIGAYAFARYMYGERRKLALFAFFASVVGAYVSHSDGALGALAIAVFFIMLFHKQAKYLAIIGAGIALCAFAASPALRSSIIREVTFQGWSGKVRMYMWRDTMAMLRDRPVFGAGLSGYPVVFRPYQTTTGIEVFQYPHMIFLNMWSELGLLGLIVFAWIGVIWIREAWHGNSSDRRQAFVAIVPLFVMLVHGLVDVPYFKNDLAFVFWLLFWCAIRTASVERPRVLVVDAEAPESGAIREAVRTLRMSEPVALPTETVYGLGACVDDVTGLERIYRIKGRPATNPLIVHVADEAMAKRYAREWPQEAHELAQAFWPGPLTIVVERDRSRVPAMVSSGSTTVALRVPKHAVMQAVIRGCGVGIAAPSANAYQAISPVTAQHVLKSLGDRVALILDAGQAEGGIESTVVDVTVYPPVVLRPGILSFDALRRVLPVIRAKEGDELLAHSPGQVRKHYAPKAKVVLISTQEMEEVLMRDAGGAIGYMTICATSTKQPKYLKKMPSSAQAYASMLFRTLHELEDASCELIYIERPQEEGGEWGGINDRLTRSSA